RAAVLFRSAAGRGMATEAKQPPPADRNGRSAKWPRAAIPMIAFLILAVSAGIGGLCYDPAALTKPSDGMADNPAVRDFAKAVEFIEDNYALTPDKERLTRRASLRMLHPS